MQQIINSDLLYRSSPPPRCIRPPGPPTSGLTGHVVADIKHHGDQERQKVEEEEMFLVGVGPPLLRHREESVTCGGLQTQEESPRPKGVST